VTARPGSLTLNARAVRRLLSAMRGLIADRKPNWWASGGVASAERQKTWRCRQARQACCLQPYTVMIFPRHMAWGTTV
jgi:hypothetical protein